ncbi:MAG: 6-phosphogluconate dehydrogenase (decarboxylating) [Deltaproteobacteria bacterium RIFCSPLOWO2_02_FULL_53_8]|nr:MAG: 6-phosphogluconate dehydrogenase (decarboxylating) [Deltaproteobacteria bacterium RIFCSPLOWO2_02_FULL_53_8]
MHIGMVGLGKMGMNMCRRLMQGGHKVSVYDRSAEAVTQAASEGALAASSIAQLTASLPSPRPVWIMLPAGAAVEETINELKTLLKPDDIIIDGGNSLYKDDLRRAKELKAFGIDYVDAGVSGGIWGLQNGYALMLGADEAVYALLEPVFAALAPKDGYMRCGTAGAGHFVKMIHNGIEYGMMEAYAEGFELLKASQYGGNLDLAAVSHVWNNGSVVRSWLLELIEDAFSKDKDLASLSGWVDDSGEGRWTVMEAIERGVNLPVITAALMRRFSSRQQDPFAEKVLAAMRAEFGGHAVKKGK